MSDVETLIIDDLAAIPEAVERARTQLVHLRAGDVVAEERTLAALLEHRDVTAASVAIDDAGKPIEALLGPFRATDKNGFLDAAALRRVPVGSTRVLSLLVGRDALLRVGPPLPERFGPYAVSEWTNRLFASAPGFLVPASTVRVARRQRSAAHALRMARTSAWTRGDVLRELAPPRLR